MYFYRVYSLSSSQMLSDENKVPLISIDIQFQERLKSLLHKGKRIYARDMVIFHVLLPSLLHC